MEGQQSGHLLRMKKNLLLVIQCISVSGFRGKCYALSTHDSVENFVYTILGSTLLADVSNTDEKDPYFSEWWETFLLKNKLSMMNLIWCPFHPYVTTVACK